MILVIGVLVVGAVLISFLAALGWAICETASRGDDLLDREVEEWL